MSEKFEFLSESWLDQATEIWASVINEAGNAIAGERLSICEVFLDPPAHLRQNGLDQVGWSLFVDDGQVSVLRAPVETADYMVRTDYQTTLPRARLILGASAEEIETRAKLRREAVAAGKIEQKGSLDHINPALRLALVELHNRLARITA